MPRISVVGKCLWLITLALTVASYAWHRMSSGVVPAFEPVPPETFEEANRRGPVVGSGPDTLVVFLDYGCPFSAMLWDTIGSVIEANASITFRIRHFVASERAEAFTAARAAECADEQDRFRHFSDVLFRPADDLVGFSVSQIADSSGVPSLSAFRECLDADRTWLRVLEDSEAAESLGLVGVPTLLAKDVRFTGSLSGRRVMELASRGN